MMDFWMPNNADFLTDERLQGAPTRIAAFYPKETNCPAANCGWDEISQSSKKADCTVCSGTGKLTTWQTYYIRARVSWTAMLQLSFVQPTPGIEQGDCVLTISRLDQAVMEQVLAAERAYLLVDNKTLRPMTMHVLEVPRIGYEYQVVCTSVTPQTLAGD